MQDVHVREKNHTKDVWMREWEEYCNGGWMFLNKRPTMMCLTNKTKNPCSWSLLGSLEGPAPPPSSWSHLDPQKCLTSSCWNRDWWLYYYRVAFIVGGAVMLFVTLIVVAITIVFSGVYSHGYYSGISVRSYKMAQYVGIGLSLYRMADYVGIGLSFI